MTAYYNEIDPFAAAWLRELIKAGHIAPGDVDERSIEDVAPDDIRNYTQVHFFAGIGVWSYSLRRAGWPDDRPVWTGSCPCQPFSAAGKSGGFADERHLWPHFHWLIDQCRPDAILGEQVASKDGLTWLDLVSSDLEGSGYAVGAVDTCSAGHGAPHIRQRLRFVAMRLADTNCQRRTREHALLREEARRQGARYIPEAAGRGEICRLADAIGQRGRSGQPRSEDASDARQSSEAEHPGPTNGFWRDADWLFCRDGKWRPVEPGTFPLAHGTPARVGRLRGYGNAVDAEATRTFVEAAQEAFSTFDLRLMSDLTTYNEGIFA